MENMMNNETETQEAQEEKFVYDLNILGKQLLILKKITHILKKVNL